MRWTKQELKALASIGREWNSSHSTSYGLSKFFHDKIKAKAYVLGRSERVTRLKLFEITRGLRMQRAYKQHRIPKSMQAWIEPPYARHNGDPESVRARMTSTAVTSLAGRAAGGELQNAILELLTQESVVEDRELLHELLAQIVTKHPGVLPALLRVLS
jgi:hypothetical protein